MRTIWTAALSALVVASVSAQEPMRIRGEAPAVKTARVQPSKIQPPKIQAAKVQAARVQAAAAEGRLKAGPSKRFTAQQDAMKALAFLDGDWRGASKVLRKDGWASMTQTNRVGTMLEGTVRMIEGRSYEPDGRMSFDALRIISYEPETKTYSMRAYQGGRVRDYALKASAGAVRWEVGSRGEAAIRYEASVKNGIWTETATRLSADGKPETYVELRMMRMRDTAWPDGGAQRTK